MRIKTLVLAAACTEVAVIGSQAKAHTNLKPNPEKVVQDHYVIALSRPDLTGDRLAVLRRNTLVKHAEFDGVGTGGFTPNDLYFTSQWHHVRINSTK